MKILHVSAECYPAAKTGGLADVVGALPKYQNARGDISAVILPMYGTKWISEQETKIELSGEIFQAHSSHGYAVRQVLNEDLGFPLFLVDIPDFFARPGVYADDNGYFYGDETERYLAFQRVVMEWMLALGDDRPDIVHCHDHHSGLIPFYMKFSIPYGSLRYIPTVFTIHNGEYQGVFGWHKGDMLPAFYEEHKGLIDWAGVVHSMASAVRCCWALTTVSPSYMQELQVNNGSIGDLIRAESHKAFGLLNGIDAEVWNPRTDSLIDYRLEDDITEWKQKCKESICAEFGLRPDLPLVSFIGRFAKEKGAFILPGVYEEMLAMGYDCSFFTLGSGDDHISGQLSALKHRYAGKVQDWIGYNEKLAHRIYAASDFLIMPSKVEPCGLNQMYAMRYGTIPIVRSVGGLKDTVIDVGDDGGGFRFNNLEQQDVVYAIHRALYYYKHTDKVRSLREKIMQYDFSWTTMTEAYAYLYNSLT